MCPQHLSAGGGGVEVVDRMLGREHSVHVVRVAVDALCWSRGGRGGQHVVLLLPVNIACRFQKVCWRRPWKDSALSAVSASAVK